MERQNVWGNNLIDFNKLTGRSDVLNSWFFIGYLMGLINESLCIDGRVNRSQLFTNEIDTIDLNQFASEDLLIGRIENEVRPVFDSLMETTSDKICLISSTLGFNNVHDVSEEAGLLARGIVESFWAGVNDQNGSVAVPQVLVNDLAEEVASLSDDWTNRFAFVEGSSFAAEVLLDDNLVSQRDSTGSVVYKSMQTLPIVADTLVEFREVLSSSVQVIGSEYIKLVRGYVI